MLGDRVDFFKAIPEIWVLLISMIPFVELRGAIPVGCALGLPFYSNLPLAILGNMIPVPFILLLMPKILNLLGKYKLFKPFVEWLRKKAEKHKGKVIKDGEEGQVEQNRGNISIGAFMALMLFVGIPLPGTGAWCGSLIAALFDLDKRWSALATFLGVVISGVIMTLASYGVLSFLSFLL